MRLNKFDKRSLTQEIALRPGNLFGALPNPDPILKAAGNDIRAYRDLRADPLIGSAIRRRKSAVKRLQRGFSDEGSSPQGEFLADILSRLDIDRIIGEIIDATLYGWQPLEVLWQAEDGHFIITDVVAKPQDWFFFNQHNELRFRSKEAGADGLELPPYKFICPVQDASVDNPYGFADLSMVFWPALFKKHGWRFWMYFSEKYGTPWLVGKHGRGESQENIEKLMSSLEQMIQDAIVVIPDDSSVEILESNGKGASSEIYQQLIETARSEISIALLGQNQTTEAETNHASAAAGLEVADDIRDSDAALVAASINQVLRWVVDLNFGEDAACPLWGLWEQEQVDEVQARRDLTLSQTRAFFTDQYYQREYGLQPGDIQPYTPAPPLPFAGGQPQPSLRFAEPAVSRDQQARDSLDDLLDTLSQGTLYSELATPLLEPLFAAVKDGATPEQLLGQLAEIYPQMDDSVLTEKLSRLLFVAKIMGRVNAERG